MAETQQNFQRAREVEVDDTSVGQRIDNFLIKCLKGVPRSHVYRILRTGQVRVNRGRIRASYRLQNGDRVRLPPLRLSEKAPAALPSSGVLAGMDQRILYEDGSLLVIDKPAGMAVHGGSGLSWGVIEAFRMLRNENYLELVHRLDRETSGCLLIARRRSALRALHEQLRDNQMKKCYLALLCGRLSKDKVTVTAALRKNVLQSGERMVRVDKDGKTARTEFRVARRFSNWTLVEARPVTGRTHQIRVHAAYIGHPIVGDGKYGDDEANRQARGMGLSRLFLHAAELGFFLPGESKRISVRSPLDRALSDYLARLV